MSGNEDYNVGGRPDGIERRLSIIDTGHSLTEDELKELKELVQMKKTARVIIIIVMTIIGYTGFPWIIDLIAKIFKIAAHPN